MCSQATLNVVTEKVVRAAKDSLGDKLERVTLYGSYARGDYDDVSDIDIMVLAVIPHEDCWKERMKISKEIGCIEIEHDVLLSVHVTDSATFKKYINTLPFYMNVLNDGVTLSA